MKWFALGSVVMFGLVVAVLLQALGPKPIVNVAERPVAIATMPCERDLQATSSGIVFDDETIITVAHAIYESRDFAVRDAAGTWYRPTIQHLDLERDLAVLKVEGLAAEALATRQARAGESVRMLEGAASGTIDGDILRRVEISTEVIGDLSTTSKRSGYELTVEIVGGDSGAAVLGDDDSLVGLIFARSTDRDASWATSVMRGWR